MISFWGIFHDLFQLKGEKSACVKVLHQEGQGSQPVVKGAALFHWDFREIRNPFIRLIGSAETLFAHAVKDTLIQ